MMIDFQPGDIVLVRGCKLRSRLARLMIGLYWNHVLIYYTHKYLFELTVHGLKHPPVREYLKRDIVVLRLIPSSDETYNNLVSNEIKDSMRDLQEGVKFDWLKYLVEWLHIPVTVTWKKYRIFKKRLLLCDEFIQLIYESAEQFIDFRDIMEHDYRDKELREKYGLQKVYDYRGGGSNEQNGTARFRKVS